MNANRKCVQFYFYALFSNLEDCNEAKIIISNKPPMSYISKKLVFGHILKIYLASILIIVFFFKETTMIDFICLFIFYLLVFHGGGVRLCVASVHLYMYESKRKILGALFCHCLDDSIETKSSNEPGGRVEAQSPRTLMSNPPYLHSMERAGQHTRRFSLNVTCDLNWCPYNCTGNVLSCWNISPVLYFSISPYMHLVC